MAGGAENFDVLIIGAGAAGLFCAAGAGKRGRRVIVIDHAERIGEKIRISGGGRCNFTNIHARPENFLSKNPKFCISALKGFTPHDFIKRVDAAAIGWHEKKLGQLFCNDSAQQIIDMLVGDCRRAGVDLRTGVNVHGVAKSADGFHIDIGNGALNAKRLVIASGGKSIPKIGATGFGYQIADQFGLGVVEPRPALAPLTFEGAIKDVTARLAGVSVDAAVTTVRSAVSGARANNPQTRPPVFRDGFLFTHRGLSGPSILQISSYWREGAAIIVDLAPDIDLYTALRARRAGAGGTAFHTALGEFLPRRLATVLCEMNGWRGNLADWSDTRLNTARDAMANWRIVPSGSEGYRTAEVTLGGVDTAALDSKTMEVKSVPGLFFIGEVVDVTGWLGGYNFQWAWSSAFAAARAV
ncbi:MAG: NAD(P)/FAD-dependent oxidoreductase [Parvularculaceae bacterium]